MMTKETDRRVFAVCMGFDAMRIAIGKKTVNFTSSQVRSGHRMVEMDSPRVRYPLAIALPFRSIAPVYKQWSETMGFEDAPHHDTTDRDFDQPMAFTDMIRDIFTDSASARLGRMIPVNQRTAQKWISNSSGMPKDVYDIVEQQHALMTKHYPRAKIAALIMELKKLGIHEEVILSEMATVYTDMSGHPPR